MDRPGIRELVGRAMIDKQFIAALVRDPHGVLTEYELTGEERAAIMQAIGRATRAPSRQQARALQNVLMKRWAT